jgi:hypothetical protein
MTVPQAIKALVKMEEQLDSAQSYAEIRKLERAAEALKLLFRHGAAGWLCHLCAPSFSFFKPPPLATV